MIKLETTEVVGWEPAIRGMRNPMNSWDKSDSYNPHCIHDCVIGPNDHRLMMALAKGGPVHAKYRRMIIVYVDITAPLYWWKEFDTYKIGTVANSCSTMHKIHDKEFTLDDFSHEYLIDELYTDSDPFILTLDGKTPVSPLQNLKDTIDILNVSRNAFLACRDNKNNEITDKKQIDFWLNGMKKYWWQMIQLLPSTYNQKRTIMMNYENLSNMYNDRKDHKLDEWKDFCGWVKTLPYNEIILGNKGD